MARVRILGTGVTVALSPGQRLLDALDEHGKPAIRTACRAGNCGICRMVVLTGDYDLKAPSSREHTTLMQLRAAANERLGCQLVLENETQEIILQPVRD